MGQGTSKYRKITRTPQTGENAGKKLWYATAVSDREMSFEDFVTHISEHNSSMNCCGMTTLKISNWVPWFR